MIHVLVLLAVFLPQSDAWRPRAVLKASNSDPGDRFGHSVGVSGSTIVVGAPEEDGGVGEGEADNSASLAGAAYVYERQGLAWVVQARLKAPFPDASDRFGQSVAIKGDIIVVGATGDDAAGADPSDNSKPNTGAAYVFERTNGVWVQTAFLKSAYFNPSAAFGTSVAVDGNVIAVGAPLQTGGGGVTLFTKGSSGWKPAQSLVTPAGTANTSRFGRSVAVSGTAVFIGAQGDSSPTAVPAASGANLSGAVHVYRGNGSTWTQEAFIKASNIGASDYFGTAISASGDTFVVSAPGEDSSCSGVNGAPDEGAPDSGAAYVFTKTASGWIQQAFLKPPATRTAQKFGGADLSPGLLNIQWYTSGVAISGDTVVVGGARMDSDSSPDAGAAFIFERQGGLWSPGGVLALATGGPMDLFGFSVAISGALVAIGAPMEDSSARGVEGTIDEQAADSGNVSTFVKPAPPTFGPSALAQTTAGGAVLARGASVHRGFVVRATIGDALLEPVSLQVEIKPAGVAFTGAPLLEGRFETSGTSAQVSVDDLPFGGLHWRVRTWNGEVGSPWVSFDASSGTDLNVVNAGPGATGARQWLEGGRQLPAGGMLLDNEIILLEATVEDPDGDDLRLEVEVVPAGTAFRGLPTSSSALARSGSTLSVPISAQRGSHAWRYRAVDRFEAASAWTGFGGNGETDPDYNVAQWGSMNTACSGSARAGGSAALAFAVLLILRSIPVRRGSPRT